MRGFRHWRWHLDEVYVKINGETHYLWRAIDQEGEILESFVTKTRDKAAALTFMKKALKRHGSPEAITTDGLERLGRPDPLLESAACGAGTSRWPAPRRYCNSGGADAP